MFLLRIVDLNILLNKPQDEIKNTLLYMFNQYNGNLSKINLPGLHFCLEVCKRLKQVLLIDSFLVLIDQLIKKYEEINEEVALLESERSHGASPVASQST